MYSNKYTGNFSDLTDEDASSFSTTETVSLRPYRPDVFREDVEEDWHKVRDYLAGRVIDPASLDLMSKNADVLESFRDSEARFENMIAKALVLEDAPEEIKESYRRIQNKFSKIDKEGIGDWAGMIKDYGIDAVTDPFNVGAVWFAAQTGGTGAPVALAARETAKATAKAALKKALNKKGLPDPTDVPRLPSKSLSTNVREASITDKDFVKGSTLKSLRTLIEKNPKKSIAALGAVQGTLDDVSRQNLAMTVGTQEDYNPIQTVATAGISAGINVGITAGIDKLTKKFKVDSDIDELTLERGSELFDEGIEGEWIPSSAASIIDDIPLISGKTGDFKDITPDEELIQKYAADIGGGAKTVEEIRNIIMSAAQTEKTAGAIKAKWKKDLYAHATHNTSRWIGKSSGVLSPFARVSPTAKILQEKFSNELGMSWKVDSRLVGKDFFETQREIQGRFFEDYRTIVEPLASSSFLKRYKENAKLADEVNDALMLAVRGEKATSKNGLSSEINKEINKASVGIKDLYKKMGVELKEAGIIENEVADYIPRSWNRKAIMENKQGLADLFEEQKIVPKGEGMKTVEDMLKINNQLDGGGSGGFFFSAKRSFDNIKKDADFQEFLDTDIRATMNLYTFQAAKGLAKVRSLGVRNEKEFKDFYINQIRKEMAEAGETFTAKDAERITRVYRTTTSENLNRFGKYSQGAVDGYGLINRVAYLGLATVSSLTEVFLNFSKAGFKNSFKGLSEAMETSYKGATGNLEAKLMSRHDLTAGEAKAEMRKFSLGMDMGLTQLENRLGGDDLQTKWMQKASSGFFKMNLLDDWTKFVQTSSFMSGKNLIHENIQALVAHGSKPLGKRQNTLIGELAELNIDYKDAIAWYKNGAKINDDFYDKTILAGAARYANSVILQPSGMSNLKPLLFSNPKTSIAFQLMGYPAAFTNTVLKGSIKQLTKDVRSGDPRNVGKVAVTALSMIQVARIMNDWRSDGKSEKDGTADAYVQAVRRVGGLGILADNITKGYDAAKYNQSVLGYATTPFGPIATDALSVDRRGIIPTLARKIPSATSPVQRILGVVDEDAAEIFKADMDQFIYETDKSYGELVESLVPEFESEGNLIGFATGGEVYNVPNVSVEPDERIDKFTGVPYNEQAGEAYTDVEDRLQFFMGGIRKKIKNALSKETRFVNKQQYLIDPDGSVLHGVEDDLLDLKDSMRFNYFEGGVTDNYVIQQGDTLTKIARENQTTVEELARINKIEDVDKIYTNDVIKLSSSSTPVEKPSKIFNTVSQMATPSTVAILKQFKRSPTNDQLKVIKKVADKIDGRKLVGVAEELINEYKQAIISKTLSAQDTVYSAVDTAQEKIKNITSNIKIPKMDIPEMSMPTIAFTPKKQLPSTVKEIEQQKTLIGTLKGLYKASGTQVAKNLLSFFNPLAGNKTEDDYTPEVISALAFATSNALKKGKSSINYKDYNLKESNVRAQVASSKQRKRDKLKERMISGNITPTEEAAFSVGGGKILIENEKVYVTDKYDFSKLEKQFTSVLTDEYGKLRDWISNYKGNEFESKIFVGTLKDLGL